MRRALAVLAVAIGCAATGTARAQQPVTLYFGETAADSAVALVPGVTTAVPLRFANPSYNTYPYYAPNYTRVTVYFDPARITVLGAQPESYGFYYINSFTAGAGSATVEASGTAYGVDAPAFRLLVQLQAGVTDGAYLRVQSDSMQIYSYYYGTAVTTALSQIGQACHATRSWGDVDENGRVDSRDALITLSAAVGLPVSGFDLALGDVDGDGLANSRDALMQLSFAIGVSPSVSTTLNRTGVGIPDVCPGLTAPGETVVFVRADGAVGGVYRLDPLSTTPVAVTSNTDDRWPRLNASGTTVAFQCADSLGIAQICGVDLAGTNRQMLTGGARHALPDWSPDGARIAYTQTSPVGIYLMDADGGNQTQFRSGVSAGAVVWRPDGAALAYNDASQTGLYTVPLDTNTTPTAVRPSGYPVGAPIRWSPDASQLAYWTSPVPWVTPAGGGSVQSFIGIAGTQAYDWSGAGIVFAKAVGAQGPSLWMLQGGPTGPLVRLTNPGATGTDSHPSLRRNP